LTFFDLALIRDLVLLMFRWLMIAFWGSDDPLNTAGHESCGNSFKICVTSGAPSAKFYR
jgi:hypothetical protein